MIFVTVGSMFPFDRLVQAVDDWVGRSAHPDVLVQIGQGSFVPAHARWVRMMRPADFNATVAACELMVAHLGMGSIITAMQARKPIVLFPRSHALGDLTSDHQAHGTEWLRGTPGIWIADNPTGLQALLDGFVRGELQGATGGTDSFASPELLARVRGFIEGGG